MSATARRRAPTPDELLRAEVDALREENADLRVALRAERVRREDTVALAAVHVRALTAFVAHIEHELKRDEAEARQR